MDGDGKLTAISRKGDMYEAYYDFTRTEDVHYSHPVYTGNESMVDGKLLVSRAYRAISTVERERTETVVYEVSEEEARRLADCIKAGIHSISRLGPQEWTIYVG